MCCKYRLQRISCVNLKFSPPVTKCSLTFTDTPPIEPEREDTSKFNPFRPRNYKKKPVKSPAESDESDVEYTVRHKVKQGITVSISKVMVVILRVTVTIVRLSIL